MDFFAGLISAILGIFGLAQAPVEEVPVVNSAEVENIEMVADTPELQKIPSEVEPDSQVITETNTNIVAEEMILTETNPTNLDKIDMQDYKPNLKTILVAGGCFWCVESDMEKLPGVVSAVSGYAGGKTDNPTYNNYGSGGHREVVEVTYDENIVSFEDILIVTLKTTDPTDDSGTFNDRGDKYSAALYYETDEQKSIIESLIKEINENGPYEAALAVDVEERPKFWPAEDEHQDYYKGTLTKLKYQYYRNASGRNDFIKKHWGTDTTPNLPWRQATSLVNKNYAWSAYVKPGSEVLKAELDELSYKVTQEDGTERAGTSPLDKNYERGIYVDILSGEPLFSSRDKYDSGTGWPSFVQPITKDAVTLHEDRKLFSVRTEVRSKIADNHLGHVFDDGPKDRGGKRYCMNGVALKFIPESEMVASGYGDFISSL